MKIKKYIGLVGCCCMLFSLLQCDLDRSPLDKFSQDNFWTSEENAMLALTGVYRGNVKFETEYSPCDWWSYCGLLWLEVATDNAYDRRGANSNFVKMTNGTLLPNNDYVKNYWTSSYAKIGRCNRFIENIDQVPMPQVEKERMKAEARFVRATQYYYLSQFFQDVPLVTRPLTDVEANKVSKSEKSEVVNFIITEFTEAAPAIPRFKDLKRTEIGRACRQAVLAFLGRIYLSEKMYTEATSTYQEIIDYGENGIDPNYLSIFTAANENSKENIFSFQYIENIAGLGLFQHLYPSNMGGWCSINPLSGLFESYEFNDGTPFSYTDPKYDSKQLGRNRDPRLDFTLLYNMSKFKGQTYICHPDSSRAVSPDIIQTGQNTQTGFLMRKYLDEAYSGPLTSSGNNLPIIRYAEVLLSYLEARLEKGDAITLDLLDNTINLVRGRASVHMPPVTELNSAKLRVILRNERRVELAMEGIRYLDLLRWGIAHEVMNTDLYGAPFPGSKRQSNKINGVTDSYGRWYVNTSAFRNPQDYKWPIPQSEQDINPNLR